MGIKRKAEEKKMSMNKNIARLAVTAGLTAALSFGGVMAPVTMAFADDAAGSTNSITIKQDENNTDAANPEKRLSLLPIRFLKPRWLMGLTQATRSFLMSNGTPM